MTTNTALAVLVIAIAYLFIEQLSITSVLDDHWYLIRALIKENKRLNEQISRISK